MLVLTTCSRSGDQEVAVENQIPSCSGTELSIEPLPVLTFQIPDSVGGASADMGRAVRLQGGGYAIADWDGRAILVFDGRGRLLHRLGRDGAGPGEYRGPILIQRLPGDSLLIWDPYLRRLSWLDSDTGESRSLALDAGRAYGARPVVGLLEDGTLLIRHEEYSGLTPAGLRRVTARLYLMDQTGREVGAVAFGLPARTEDPRGYRFFSPYLQIATDGHRIYVGESSSWEIRVLGPDGRQTASLTRSWTPREVTAADRVEARAAFPGGRGAPAFIPDERFDSTVPAFGRILLSDDQSVWVLGYSAPYVYPDSVTRFTPEGRFIARVALPPRFNPTEAGSDYLLGTGSTDQEDFEVRVYRLTCKGSTSR